MYSLSSINTVVQDVIVRSSIRDFEKIALRNMAHALFKDVQIEGTLLQQPAVVVDTLEAKSPALLVVFRFATPKSDECTYTFQFEVWPTSTVMRITPPPWMPRPVRAVPKPKMKVSFIAERNSVVYFNYAHEGNFKDVLSNMAKALGR